MSAKKKDWGDFAEDFFDEAEKKGKSTASAQMPRQV